MEVELLTAEPAHADELGRILFEAYKDIADRHHFPPIVRSVGTSRQSISAMLRNPDTYGVTAVFDGDIVGGAFVTISDEVAGIAPVCVDVTFQGQGIGRSMMSRLLDYARTHGFFRIRLIQEAHNIGSLSLYASLGFETQDTAVFMNAAPLADPEGLVRPMAESDLTEVAELCKGIYKVDRGKEIRRSFEIGRPALVRERDGRLTGYFMPAMGGHAVAATHEDAMALIGEAGVRIGTGATFLCPLSDGRLFREALAAGCRATEALNLMAIGPYERPSGVWMPSGLF
ncbi:MAG: GNAT family N-acetyltransferase [Chloroflexi bacterium]|nr:GNAT family N-acetyltransferase [Chloroflexota bacterium]